MNYGLDTSPSLKETRVCHWCGNSLRHITNPWKGKDSERWYCGQEHHKKGEEQVALRALKAVRGRGWDVISSHYLVSAAILCVLMLAFIFTGGHRAWAHSPDTHQADELSDAYSDAYGKCCVGDDYHKLRIEQWETTDTGWRINWHGQWLDVPRRARVSNMDNPDGDAKAWVFGEPDTTYVRCFMPGAQS